MALTLRRFMPAALVVSLALAFPTAHAQGSSVSGTSAANIADTTPKELKPSGASAGSREGDPRSNGVANAPNHASGGASSMDDDKAVKNLTAAAQLLRESIQRMAQAPAGEGRTQAIRQGNEALLQVNNAILTLPSHLLQAGGSEHDYSRSVTRIKEASDKLYAAVHALAREPGSTGRNQAIREVNQALAATNAAMANGIYLQADKDQSKAIAKASASASTVAKSGTSGTADSGMSGSALRTGHPPANNVDLAPTASGASSGSGGTGATGQAAR